MGFIIFVIVHNQLFGLSINSLKFLHFYLCLYILYLFYRLIIIFLCTLIYLPLESNDDTIQLSNLDIFAVIYTISHILKRRFLGETFQILRHTKN